MVQNIKIDKFLSEHRNKISLVLLLVVLIFLLAKQGLKEKPITTTASQSLETFIPHGYILVPIEIKNLIQLKSLIDDKAIVDLFVTDHELAIMEAVRLVRAPKNPDIFAVLIPEDESKRLLQYGHEFLVVVKNRKAKPRKKKKKKKNRILYQEPA